MNSKSQHIFVASQDILSCKKCHAGYVSIQNEAMLLDCGFSVCSLCEEELRDQKQCPLCDKEHSNSKPAKINQMVSELLKGISQASKCPTHQIPLDFKKEGKLYCSECFIGKQKARLILEGTIPSKLKELKISGKKSEENLKKALKNEVIEYNSNFKRRIDDLDEEMFACLLGNSKKLKIQSDIEILKTLNSESLGPLFKFREDVKVLEEKFENKKDPEIAVQILDMPLATEFSLDTVEKVRQRIEEKNEKRDNKIIESQQRLLENLKQFFHSQWSDPFFNQSMLEFDARHYPEIARKYLLETFEAYGFIANDRGGCVELKESVKESKLAKFYPELFWLPIDKLKISCRSASDSQFQILCEILQKIQTLSNLALYIDDDENDSLLIMKSVLALLDHSKALQKIFCEKSTDDDEDMKEFIELLFNSKKISNLTIECSPRNIIVELLQNQLQSPGQEASMMEESSSLQELNLGFARIKFLEGELSQIISGFIKNSHQLKKVSLFLAGKRLSENDILNDLFSLNDQTVSRQHCLEKFSLTLLLLNEVEIEVIIDYLRQFPQLKNVELIVNLRNTSPRKLIDSLDRILQKEPLPLFSLDIKCRPSDFPPTTHPDRKYLQEILCKRKISCQFVFERLTQENLPDYVEYGNFISERLRDEDVEEEDESGGEEENEKEGDSEGEEGVEEEGEGDGDGDGEGEGEERIEEERQEEIGTEKESPRRTI